MEAGGAIGTEEREGVDREHQVKAMGRVIGAEILPDDLCLQFLRAKEPLCFDRPSFGELDARCNVAARGEERQVLAFAAARVEGGAAARAILPVIADGAAHDWPRLTAVVILLARVDRAPALEFRAGGRRRRDQSQVIEDA